MLAETGKVSKMDGGHKSVKNVAMQIRNAMPNQHHRLSPQSQDEACTTFAHALLITYVQIGGFEIPNSIGTCTVTGSSFLLMFTASRPYLPLLPSSHLKGLLSTSLPKLTATAAGSVIPMTG